MRARPLPRSAARLLAQATAFQGSQILFALVGLGIPALLTGRARRLSDLARALGIHPAAAERFLGACVALGLLERRGDRFRNTRASERFLVRGRNDYLGDVILHQARAAYPRWGGLQSRLLDWRPGAGRPGRCGSPAAIRALRDGHHLATRVGEALCRAYEFGRHRRLLDLGGGTGAMAIAICRANPKLAACVLELPPAAALARRFVARSGLADRIEVESGNFLKRPLPQPFDVALLACVLSLLGEASERALLARIHASLEPGGALLIGGWILDDDGRGPLPALLMCLEDVGWSAADLERSGSTYASWLREAGFRVIGRRVFASPWSVLVARKPGPRSRTPKKTLDRRRG